MATAASLPEPNRPAPAEQRILLHNVTWKDYVILRDVLDGPTPRMTYCAGVLELLSPSPDHERWKKNIARLLEMYAYFAGIDLRAYGSATFKKEAQDRGAEPDECYLIGKELAAFPEIALEVVHTAPLLDKLDVYAAMQVAEVWVFEKGAFSIHCLDARTNRYALQPRSALLPGLDFAILARYAVRDGSLATLREFETEIRAGL